MDSFGRLWIYSPDHHIVLGAYTYLSANNGSFVTPFILGDSIIIEYDEFASTYSPTSLMLNVKAVGHGFEKSLPNAGLADCYLPANCPQWNSLCNQIRSNVYVQLEFNSGKINGCSGSLLADVNDSYRTNTYYILTARHCLVDPATGSTNNITLGDYTLFGINFEIPSPTLSPTCTGGDYNFLYNGYSFGGTGYTGQEFIIPGNAITNHWETGSGNSGGGVDVAIIEVQWDLPIQWNPYLAGWDRNTSASNIPNAQNGHKDVTCVHHPNGWDAKISEGNVVPHPILYPNKWYVNWDQSTTHEGSSGSPIFDADNKIIGSLSQATGGLHAGDNCSHANALFGKIGLMDAFPGVIATEYPSGNVSNSFSGIDPMLICQNEIDINSPVYDASLWRATNTGSILIEADNKIVVNSFGQGTPFLKNCNYILQAGSEILFEPGGSGAVIQGNVTSVVATIHDCTPINNTCYNFSELHANNDGYTNAGISNSGYSFVIYPNPSAGQCTAKFAILVDANVTITLSDIMGRDIETIDQSWHSMGTSFVPFSTKSYAPGMYLVRFTDGTNTSTQRLVIAQKE
jgi:hypothetical protein